MNANYRHRLTLNRVQISYGQASVKELAEACADEIEAVELTRASNDLESALRYIDRALDVHKVSPSN